MAERKRDQLRKNFRNILDSALGGARRSSEAQHREDLLTFKAFLEDHLPSIQIVESRGNFGRDARGVLLSARVNPILAEVTRLCAEWNAYDGRSSSELNNWRHARSVRSNAVFTAMESLIPEATTAINQYRQLVAQPANPVVPANPVTKNVTIEQAGPDTVQARGANGAVYPIDRYEVCCICLEKFGSGSENMAGHDVHRAGCSHLFHVVCINNVSIRTLHLHSFVFFLSIHRQCTNHIPFFFSNSGKRPVRIPVQPAGARPSLKRVKVKIPALHELCRPLDKSPSFCLSLFHMF